MGLLLAGFYRVCLWGPRPAATSAAAAAESREATTARSSSSSSSARPNTQLPSAASSAAPSAVGVWDDRQIVYPRQQAYTVPNY